MVAHCLLVETPSDGLVLVETGIGLDDVADAPHRLGRAFTGIVRPGTDRARTAIEQVRSLGFDPAEVRHIVVTHLDLDHAGGLGDFPDATVHLHVDELSAAQRPSLRERNRYRANQWAHGPNWATFGSGGEEWFGFPAVRDLPGLPAQILAIPLPGHSRGHSAVAVESDRGWLLHCGDAYFHEATVDPSRAPAGPLLGLFENAVALDRARVRDNHSRLAELHSQAGGDVQMFSAHDPEELRRMAAQA